jgi:hypothetical protein
MAKYVLFGGPFLNVDGPHKGERFGEVLEFSEEDGRELILTGAAILPQADFDALFTKDDVTKYPNALMQERAPEAFKKNLLAAAVAWGKLRVDLAKRAEAPRTEPAVERPAPPNALRELKPTPKENERAPIQ